MKKYFIYLSFGILFFTGCKNNPETITVLSWAGYNETEIKNFIENNVKNVSLQFVTYTGGEDMLRKFLNNKKKFDLLVVDAEYGKILYDKGEIQKINLDEIETAKVTMQKEYMPKFNYSIETPGYIDENDVYSLIIRWGTLGLVGQSKYVNEIDSFGYNVLLEKQFENKITLFDWYLPNMGIFSLMYMSKNNIKKNPFDLSSDELNSMYKEIMIPLRKNVKSFYADLGLVIQSAYEDETCFIPGIGEWAIGNKLVEGDKSRDWYIPKQGGIIWVEAASIPKHVTDKSKLNKIHEILELFTTKEFQAKLAWRDAYNSHVPNKEAYGLMTPSQREALKYDKINEFLNDMYFRKVPENISSEWINLWSEFKNQ